MKRTGFSFNLYLHLERRALDCASAANRCSLSTLLHRVGFHQRFFYQMFTQEPELQFIGAKHVANDQIIRSFVADFLGALRKLAAIANDYLVSVKQTR